MVVNRTRSRLVIRVYTVHPMPKDVEKLLVELSSKAPVISVKYINTKPLENAIGFEVVDKPVESYVEFLGVKYSIDEFRKLLPVISKIVAGARWLIRELDNEFRQMLQIGKCMKRSSNEYLEGYSIDSNYREKLLEMLSKKMEDRAFKPVYVSTLFEVSNMIINRLKSDSTDKDYMEMLVEEFTGYLMRDKDIRTLPVRFIDMNILEPVETVVFLFSKKPEEIIEKYLGEIDE